MAHQAHPTDSKDAPSQSINRFTRRHFIQTLAASAACAPLIQTGCASQAYAAQSLATLSFDPNQQAQPFYGFGASGAWWAQGVGQWPEKYFNRVLDLLYTDQNSDLSAGAGLSIYRYNVGAGGDETFRAPWRTTESFEVAPGEYDWSKDAAAVRVMKGVIQRGCQQVVFFANSAPPRMLNNGLPSGGPNGGPNLKPEYEAEFAQYMVDVAAHWTKQLNIAHPGISPVNEPQWHWGKDRRHQEGCHMQPDQVARVLRQTVDKALIQQTKGGSHFAIEGPESGQWGGQTMDYIRAIAQDDVLRQNLACLAIHSYWTGPEAKAKFVADVKKLIQDRGIQLPPIMMTEWTQMKSGRDTGMTSALELAKTIWEDLTIGQSQSWTYWIAASPYDYHDGLIYVSHRRPSIKLTKRLPAIGQYARFAKPGSVVLPVNCNAPNLQTTGFLSANGQHIAIVITNPTGSDQTLALKLPQDTQLTQPTVWITDDKLSLTPRNLLVNKRLHVPAGAIVTLTSPLATAVKINPTPTL